MDGAEVIKKYLEHYAEPEAKAALAMTYHYQHVVIIPAYNEYDNLIDTLHSIKEKNVLAIVVVNSIEDDCKTAVSTNQKLLKFLRKNNFEIWRAKSGQGISLHQVDKIGLLLIDRCSGQLKLPKKCGVGLARKIAADVALALIYNNNIKSSWIHSTDADVILPEDYFSRTNNLPIKTSAAIYPYHHTIDNDCDKHKNAVLMYEISLRHYVIGLKKAGSPYAFHTIGSTMAISAQSYAAVRGFPKREAGEDFYMLNKLAKIGAIERLNGDPIQISGRVSDRVPFGTGQAVNKIISLKNPTDEYEFYNPKIFSLLQFWLSELKQLTPVSNLQKFEQRIRQKARSPQLISGLEKLGAFHAIKNILKQMNNNTIPMHQIHNWFDGFRTLKLIHHLRDNGFPSIKLKELFEFTPYQQYSTIKIDDMDTVKNTLEKIERDL